MASETIDDIAGAMVDTGEPLECVLEAITTAHKNNELFYPHGLPEDVADFLKALTSYTENNNAGTANEWGESLREDADRAVELCTKYNIKCEVDLEHREDGYCRSVYNDGTKGPWE